MRGWIAALVVATGCGSGDGTATIRLTTEDTEPVPGLPVAGARLAVIAGGAPTLLVTDEDGEVEVVVDGATTVIVLRDDAVTPSIYVVTGLDAGARVELGARPRPAPTSIAGVQTVTYTPFPGGPWAVDNDYFPCSDGGFTSTPGLVEIETSTGCEAIERTMYLTAYDATTLAPQAFAAVEDVAAVPGERIAGAWEPGTDYQIAFTGLPADAAAAYTELAYDESWRLVIVNTPIAGGGGTGARREATIEGRAGARSRITVASGLPFWIHEPDVAPPTVTVDAAALGVPRVISGVAYDPATRALTWTEAPGRPPTLIAARFRFLDPISTLPFTWTVLAPVADGRLAIPEIPDELTAYDLRPSDTVELRDLWLVTVDDATYAGLLADADLDLPRFESDGYRPSAPSLLSGGAL